MPIGFRKRDASVRMDVLRILAERNKQLSRIASAVGSLDDLSRTTCEMIVDVILDELSEKGLRADSEPNQYGLRIEELVAHLNEIVIRKSSHA